MLSHIRYKIASDTLSQGLGRVSPFNGKIANSQLWDRQLFSLEGVVDFIDNPSDDYYDGNE